MADFDSNKGFDPIDSHTGGGAGGKLPIILTLALFFVLLIAGIVAYARLSGNLGLAQGDIEKLGGTLTTSIETLDGVSKSLGEYSKRNDDLNAKISDAVKKHDEQLAAMGGIANSILDRLSGVDTEVGGVKTDVKGHGVQITTLKKKLAALDQQFGDIREALKAEGEKNKMQFGDVLAKIDAARKDLASLKDEVDVVKASVEFVPSEGAAPAGATK
jgi:chromosome segregation ATPase